MITRVPISALIAVLVPLAFSGCFSSSEVKSTNPTSVGQQLTDLDRAYHQGIITEKEYLSLKKAIINKND
jgi:predicted metalloprotease